MQILRALYACVCFRTSTAWYPQLNGVTRNIATRNLTKKDVAAEPRAQDAPREEYERLETMQLPDAVM
eukprot:7795330-Pyramimonas_sp.AAC.1